MRILKTLILAMTTLYSLHATAAPRCADLFSKKANVEAELRILRTQIERLRSEGDSAMARLLYGEFQLKLQEARAMGLGIDAIAVRSQKNESHERERRAIQDEWRLRLIFTPVYKFEGSILNRESAELSEDGAHIRYMSGDSFLARSVNSGVETLLLTAPNASDVAVDARQTSALIRIKNNVEIRDLITHQPLARYTSDRGLMSRDGNRVAIENGTHVIIVDPHNGEQKAVLAEPCTLFRARLSSDGSTLVTVSGGRAKLWNVATGGLIRDFDVNRPTEPSFSADGRYLVILSKPDLSEISNWNIEPELHVYDLSIDKPIQLIRQSELVSNAVLSSDGLLLIAATKNGKTIIRDVSSGAILNTIETPEDVHDIRISQDGKRLLLMGIKGPPATVYRVFQITAP